MKTFLKIIGLITALTLVLLAGQARGQDDSGVSFQTFYDQLASQGNWIQTSDYGYVFQPNVTDSNWRPYMYGHWVNTDAGMTWVSDEPFGWATYHYGRWVDLDGEGWVWVPGYTWAPAWVSWRDGDDYVGWAPLPPDSDVGIDFFDDSYFAFGFHIGDDCDLAYGIGPACYNFCPVAFIGDRDAWRHFRDRRDNFAFIGRTRNVTNINFRQDGAGRFGRVHAEGPSVAALNARARTPIAQAQLTSASRPDNAGLRGNSLAVFAPRVNLATAGAARPNRVNGTLANTSVNRGIDINRPLMVNSRVSPVGATAAQVHAAALAQHNVSASAKVATAGTRFSRSLTRSLASLHTATFRSPTESRYTGESVTPRPAISSAEESAYTGQIFRQPSISPARTISTTGGIHSSSMGESHRSSGFFHSASTPLFHSSAPVYHPASGFRSIAPAPHFGGGAPAAQASRGSFGGGGRPSGGGGAVHASAGGGRSDGGRR